MVLFANSHPNYFANFCCERGVTTFPHYVIFKYGDLSDEVSTCSECLLECVILKNIEEIQGKNEIDEKANEYMWTYPST
ncbi:hypothetical protein HI914_00113 [Erysiphe necator]|nr:hypothetical protein HI914_00113 [Erysiphe necator]